jgi:hypothetical protein
MSKETEEKGYEIPEGIRLNKYTTDTGKDACGGEEQGVVFATGILSAKYLSMADVFVAPGLEEAMQQADKEKRALSDEEGREAITAKLKSYGFDIKNTAYCKQVKDAKGKMLDGYFMQTQEKEEISQSDKHNYEKTDGYKMQVEKISKEGEEPLYALVCTNLQELIEKEIVKSQAAWDKLKAKEAKEAREQ